MLPQFRTARSPARWLLLCTWPLLANAQSAAPPPAHPTPTPAPQAYVSAFDGYKPYTDEPIHPWVPANATVAHIGGWRSYAKEAATPDPSASGNTPAKAHHQHPEAPK